MKSLSLFLLFFSVPVFAGIPCTKQVYTDPKKEPDYDCPGPGEVVYSELKLKSSAKLSLGDPAPWSGILMDSERVIQLGVRIISLRRLRWLDFKTCAERLESERVFMEKSSLADLKYCTSQRQSCQTQLVAVKHQLDKKSAWYNSCFFGVAVGALTATTIMSLIWVIGTN